MQRNRIPNISSCKECEGQAHSKLFCCLAKDDLDKISEGKADNFYKKGQVIFYEGNRGHGIYCIYKGKVKIHKLGDEAKDQIVRFANKGDVLGYRSILSNEPYNATATALEDSIICYLPKSKFMEVLEKNHELSYKAIQLLTNDLRQSEEKIINITQKTVIERITESLLILKEKFGLKEDGKTLDIQLTRKEVGNIAGVTTETTIRTLSDLNKKRIINLKGKQIELVNIPRLVQLSNVIN